jgi:hypothetical protein
MFPNRSTPSLSPHPFVQNQDFKQPWNRSRDLVEYPDPRHPVPAHAMFVRARGPCAGRYQRAVRVEFTTSCCQLYLAKMGLLRDTPAFGQGALRRAANRPEFRGIGKGVEIDGRAFTFRPAGSGAGVSPTGSFLEVGDDRCPASKAGGRSKPRQTPMARCWRGLGRPAGTNSTARAAVAQSVRPRRCYARPSSAP